MGVTDKTIDLLKSCFPTATKVILNEATVSREGFAKIINLAFNNKTKGLTALDLLSCTISDPEGNEAVPPIFIDSPSLRHLSTLDLAGIKGLWKDLIEKIAQ